MRDRSISITYEVYQYEGMLKRLVGKYDCKCVAKDVKEYLQSLGIHSYIVPIMKEEVY